MATPDHRPVRLCWGPMGERPNTVRHAACLGWSMPVGARFSRPGWFSAFVARFACATFAQWVVGFRCSVAERTSQRPSKTENPQPKTSSPAQWPRGSRGCYREQMACRTVLRAPPPFFRLQGHVRRPTADLALARKAICGASVPQTRAATRRVPPRGTPYTRLDCPRPAVPPPCLWNQ